MKHTSPSSVLSLQQAVDLFDDLANRQDLGLGFVRTTCYPQAYVACEIAKERGLSPSKAWAFEEEGKPLAGQHPSGGPFKWWFHVALALPVQTSANKVETLVFDPKLFDGPVRLTEWSGKIGAAPHRSGIFGCEESPSTIARTSVNMSAAHSPSMTARALEKISLWASLEPQGQRLVHPSQTMRGLPPVKRQPKCGWNIHRQESSTPRPRTDLAMH